jgi:hypothetical protein
MNILETIKGLFGGKATDMVTGVAGDMTAKVSDMATDAAANLINFDDINVEKFIGYANQFGIMDKIKEMSPEIAAKLGDGTLSDEDVKSFIPQIKELIMSKMGK